MTILQITQYISTAIPLVSFAALFVSVFLFAKTKGNMDALKSAADTYRTLAQSKDAKIDELESKIDSLQAQVTELTKALEVQKQAFSVAIDEFLARVSA